MQSKIDLILLPEEAADERIILKKAAAKLKIEYSSSMVLTIVRRSIDARKKPVKINLSVLVSSKDHKDKSKPYTFKPRNVEDSKKVIIVGAGPAGLFAAMELIEKGLKPVIVERGKGVVERRKDLAPINKNISINEDSNYCFGEGGAGTFSDGKLYTRSLKRGRADKVLGILHQYGASKNILIDAHPHIGSNLLPKIIVRMRESIIAAGGEFHFDHKMTDLIIEDQTIKGVVTEAGGEFVGEAVILATGHSARDIYELLHEKEIALEAKSFAMGVRVEHPQELIDQIQYHSETPSEYLPAASYSLVAQAANRGVYSFCMCPGGFIVPAASGPKETVVNGMSLSGRDSAYANSGIVVEIRMEDFPEQEKYGALAGLRMQQDLERLAYQNGGNGIVAPAQRLQDFVKGRISQGLPETSYHPGIISSPLHFWLPEHISKRLKVGFKSFGKRMKGFLTNDAVIVGVESRTSSPVRIPRDKETLEHIEISRLYPAGEGAGYAGGIVSAAMDGQRIANAIVEAVK